MKKNYECMVLLDNRQVREGWEPLKEAVTGLFTKHGAEIVSARRWDERRLAYPIKGQNRGTYLLIYYAGESTNNSMITRELELNEPTLRHLITQCEEIPEDAYEPEAEFDVNAIPTDDEPEPEEKAEDKAEDKTEEKAEDKASSDDTEKAGSDEAPDAASEKPEGGETADASAPDETATATPEPAAAPAAAESESDTKNADAAPDAKGAE